MAPRLPIGISDFREVRQGAFYYVDKTALVGEVLRAGAKVILLPRPRRFGKTLNLSMLRTFVERGPDARPLFAGLAVEAEGEEVWAHFQRHPVIFMTFKDVKAASWPQCLAAIQGVLAETLTAHRSLLTDGALQPEDADTFTAILSRRADEVTCWGALRLLSRLLHAQGGERVVILIDEYDTPIHAGAARGYLDEVVTFFRNFLSGGLKDSPHLEKGVLTGILRVAKESIFSGLNNLAVYSLLSRSFATAFGFTEEEVRRLAADLGAADQLAELSRWYNGYLFGGQLIYNPWSVLSYLGNQDDGFRAYWVSTSSDEHLRALLLRHGTGAGEMETLLQGGTIDKPIEENVVLRDLERQPEALWSFLLFSGYLKATTVRQGDEGTAATLAIPNREVAMTYRTTFRLWLEASLGGAGRVQQLLSALLTGAAADVEDFLGEIVASTLSVHDVGDGGEPERVYHAFLAGLLVALAPRFEVRSNRESGYGRYDVMVLPKEAGEPGVVMELKVVNTRRGETPEAALTAAAQQLRSRDYAQELRQRGAQPIHELAIAFSGKQVWVRAAG
jgi:hypothetical protein